jgi:hypothetical protein
MLATAFDAHAHAIPQLCNSKDPAIRWFMV